MKEEEKYIKIPIKVYDKAIEIIDNYIKERDSSLRATGCTNPMYIIIQAKAKFELLKGEVAEIKYYRNPITPIK